jgi:uncharacterized membrane protein YoaT (DUF817 family)
MVPPSKLGAWLLLMIVSYALVHAVARRRPPRLKSPFGAD